ncbi:MAG: CDP-glucose 4,6-dehydratase [Comamonadaceae bacterium]|nr:CDP-glucose 4,6-dehydratase [Comamonadaceae bacterium]
MPESAVESLDLTHCFRGAYRGRRVLVTGHTGFKGSWLVLWLRSMGADVSGLALPPDTEPSHYRLLSLGIAEALIDLRDAEAVASAVRRMRPELVFHLAAQPLVRRSFREPVATVATNVMGLVYLLEAVRGCSTVRAVVNVTTDKCYEVDERAVGYTEEDRLGGYDPYSASKACAEILSACWRRSFLGADSMKGQADVLLATARAGNVLGGGDWAEDRLVPDLVRAASTAG